MMHQHTKTLSTHLTVERSLDQAEWGARKNKTSLM